MRQSAIRGSAAGKSHRRTARAVRKRPQIRWRMRCFITAVRSSAALRVRSRGRGKRAGGRAAARATAERGADTEMRSKPSAKRPPFSPPPDPRGKSRLFRASGARPRGRAFSRYRRPPAARFAALWRRRRSLRGRSPRRGARQTRAGRVPAVFRRLCSG